MARSTSKHSNPDYEKLARAVHQLIQLTYEQPKKIYARAFIRGIFSGLGSALGATIVLTFVLWILTLFGDVPLIGRLVDLVQDSMQ